MIVILKQTEVINNFLYGYLAHRALNVSVTMRNRNAIYY